MLLVHRHHDQKRAQGVLQRVGDARERRTAPSRLGIRTAGLAFEIHHDHQGEQTPAAGRRAGSLGLLGGRIGGLIEISDHARPEERQEPERVLPQQ